MRNQIFLFVASVAIVLGSCKKAEISKEDHVLNTENQSAPSSNEALTYFGVDNSNRVWKSREFEFIQLLDKSLVKIAANRSAVFWGLSDDGDVWRYDQGTWTVMTYNTGFKHITIGGEQENHVYCLSHDNRLLKFKNGNWTYPIWGKKFKTVDADNMQNQNGLWGIDLQDNVVRSNNNGSSWSTVSSPATMKHITSNGLNECWAIDTSNEVWRYLNGSWYTPTPNFKLKQVDCGAFGIHGIFGLNPLGQTYYYGANNNSWNYVNTGFIDFKWITSSTW